MSDHDYAACLELAPGEPSATVHFVRDNVKVQVKLGTSILHAGLARDLVMESACGEVCACSTCHVWVESGKNLLSTPEDDEEDTLDKAKIGRAHV